MTKRLDITPAPEPLEAYAKHFDALLGKSNQREGFRRYLEGLLLPSERHKTLTGLANTEPVVGAQLARAQKAAMVSLRVGLAGASSATTASAVADGRPLDGPQQRGACWSAMRLGIAKTATKQPM